MCYGVGMTAKILNDAMKRVETWPREAREELGHIALEIDAALKGGIYRATTDELVGIDRGLVAANKRRFVAPADVEAVFARHRPA